MTKDHRQHHYDNQRDDIDYESLYTQMATILIMMNVIIMIDTIKTITIETMIIVIAIMFNTMITMMIIMIQISIKQQTYTKN